MEDFSGGRESQGITRADLPNTGDGAMCAPKPATGVEFERLSASYREASISKRSTSYWSE